MKEEILQKLENGCDLEALFDSELTWLLYEANANPEGLMRERDYE